jgi:hypothetical protein
VGFVQCDASQLRYLRVMPRCWCLASRSDSKLTRLTSEALGGVCKTSFIATITPAETDIGETMSTLRYAKNAMEGAWLDCGPRRCCVSPRRGGRGGPSGAVL